MTIRPPRPVRTGRLEPQSRSGWTLVAALGVLLGWTALQAVLSLPSSARYVTFAITPSHILNGGWATWHTGGDMGPVTVPPDAMDAGLFRVALWCAVALGAAMMVPAITLWWRR